MNKTIASLLAGICLAATLAPAYAADPPSQPALGARVGGSPADAEYREAVQQSGDAYREAKAACREVAKAERSACRKEARDVMKRTRLEAKQRHDLDKRDRVSVTPDKPATK